MSAEVMMIESSVKLHQRDRETQKEEERATASSLHPENSSPTHSEMTKKAGTLGRQERGTIMMGD